MKNDEIGRLTELILILTKKVDELTGLVQASERNAAERHALFMNIEDSDENAEDEEISETLLEIPPGMRKFLPKGS
ncbi:hypothetical protein GCM10007874_45690 [Labrys miyagiensis]|uniref:Uncharacterized protein n=1 Tax=Labrys miyagiensis TaxID=346912 RepID=A0ABQ6CTH3_9HYPH|nr:hypothetical protein [Labrys miyagiensis]GLS21552.1 hypothetical protein GCM10007874_45690 [Labrys miyagiensis]